MWDLYKITVSHLEKEILKNSFLDYMTELFLIIELNNGRRARRQRTKLP